MVKTCLFFFSLELGLDHSFVSPYTLVMKLLLIVLILFLSFSAVASSQDIDLLFKKYKLNKNNFSILIQGIDGKKIYNLHSNKQRMPASLTKIFVASAVLDKLFYHKLDWQPQIWGSKLQPNGSVDYICLKGRGYPSFVSEDMWKLVNQFTRKGIVKINKAVYVDSTAFDAENIHTGRQKSRVLRAYDAPVSALSFNWNSVNIYVNDEGVNLSAPKVLLDPENFYLKLENRLKYAPKSRFIKIDRKKNAESDSFILTGKFAKNSKEKVYYRNITRPEKWAGHNLIAFLKQRGIESTKKVISTKCPSSMRLLSELDTKDLFLVLRDMMKYSNNFITEMLVKYLGLVVNNKGSFDSGLKVLNQHLAENNIDLNVNKIISVSGLSRANKTTAEILARILKHRWETKYNRPEFLSSLPLLKIDGTLKTRGSKPDAKIRAKTGLLSGVVGLAGYVLDTKFSDKIVVLMYNAKNGKNDYQVRKFFDEVIESI